MFPCRLLVLGALALSSAAAAEPAPSGLLIDRVWSGDPVSFALLTEGDHQYVAYYDAERRLTVCGRTLADARWTRVQPDGVPVPARNRQSNVTGWDSHNYLARRWVLRWETLPRNRDQPRASAPPPAELRLYEFPDTPISTAARVGS